MRAQSPLGVNLAGYFTAATGLAQMARYVQTAMESAGLSVNPIALPAAGAPPPAAGRGPGHSVTVVCANPEGMAGAREALGSLIDSGRVIGLWWWEVGVFP